MNVTRADSVPYEYKNLKEYTKAMKSELNWIVL